jgi:hypothetical protein
MQWYLATEDALSQALATKLLNACQSNVEIVSDLGLEGNSKLREGMKKYCELAKHYPILVMTDLDQNACAPALKTQWCRGLRMPVNLVFRVAVREAEAWMIADLDAFSRFSGISKGKLPRNVESWPSPKEQVIDQVRKYGNRGIKDILPRKGSTAKVSPSYNNILIRFVEQYWDPMKAQHHSRSLKKAITRLSNLTL